MENSPWFWLIELFFFGNDWIAVTILGTTFVQMYCHPKHSQMLMNISVKIVGLMKQQKWLKRYKEQTIYVLLASLTRKIQHSCHASIFVSALIALNAGKKLMWQHLTHSYILTKKISIKTSMLWSTRKNYNTHLARFAERKSSEQCNYFSPEFLFISHHQLTDSNSKFMRLGGTERHRKKWYYLKALNLFS